MVTLHLKVRLRPSIAIVTVDGISLKAPLNPNAVDKFSIMAFIKTMIPYTCTNRIHITHNGTPRLGAGNIIFLHFSNGDFSFKFEHLAHYTSPKSQGN